MYCRNCGDRVPSDAAICPGCGARTGMGKKKSVLAQWWFWLIAVALIVGCILAFNFAVIGAYVYAEPPMPGEMVVQIQPVAEAPAEEDDQFAYEDALLEDEDVPVSNVSVDEAVIYDDKGITVTTKGYEDMGYGKRIKVLVENNSGRDALLNVDTLIVNGISVRSGVYIEVKDGKKINDAIGFYQEELEMAGITELATIATFDGWILDPESNERLDDIDFEIKTSLADTYQQAIDDSGELIYEQDGVTVVYQKNYDTIMGKAFRFFVKNNSGRDLVIQSRDVAVNDYMLSGSMSDTVCDGTVAYCELLLYGEDLEENGIQELETMSFVLRFVDPISYDTLWESSETEVPIGG